MSSKNKPPVGKEENGEEKVRMVARCTLSCTYMFFRGDGLTQRITQGKKDKYIKGWLCHCNRVVEIPRIV